MFYLAIFFLCGFPDGALMKGQKSKGKYSTPLLDIQSRQLVMEANQTLTLQCKGRWELVWSFPRSVMWDQQSVSMKERRCGKQQRLYCSSLTVSPALAEHTGSYRCRYQHKQSKQAMLYVYIAGSHGPFVEQQSDIPDVVYLKDEQALVIPCRVTAPNTKVALVKFPGQVLLPDQKNIIWNSRRGFIIPKPTYHFIGLFSCEATINGNLYSSKYLTYRPVNKILDVYLNITESLAALRGHSFALNCTVTAAWNSRVSISWKYPGQKTNQSAFIMRRILPSSSSRVFYSVLSIPQLRRSDSGLYVCRVRSGPSQRETNTSLVVYDRPFISLKQRKGAMLEAAAGQKAFRLSAKLRAFPKPQVMWMKDGAPATERCSRYHMDGHSIVIHDVSPEDAGVYTMLAAIPQYRLYRNLTLALAVRMRPQIEEKAMSPRDVGLVQLGASKTLLCTSQGSPAPSIHWLWHRCPKKGQCKADVFTQRDTVTVSTSPRDTENDIQSINQRWEVIEGKNKTVSVLTVAHAHVSGIFRCVASNHMGSDWRDVPLYVTDTPGGFSIHQEGEPREGMDLHLLCRASKHLYTSLSWHLAMPPSDTPTLSSPDTPATPPPDTSTTPLPGYLAQSLADTQAPPPPDNPAQPIPKGSVSLQHGVFSNTLRLTLRNLTVWDSNTYSCHVHHRLTGKEFRLDASVEVVTLQAPVLLYNLTDGTVNVSSSITLTCAVWGVPRPVVTWEKNHRRLHLGSGVLLTPEAGTLHIERITVEDEGLYTCSATNEKGSVESSAYLWVNDSAEVSPVDITTLTCTSVVATLFWLILTLFIRKLRKQNSMPVKANYLSIILDPAEGALNVQGHRLPYDPGKWEFPRDRLKLEKPLGRGAFGKVMQASAFGINNSSSCKTVAVKMLKEGATPSEHKALMTELKILIHIGQHLNVVNLLGACTKPGGPLLVVVEYCKYGNLSTYLKSKRDVFLLKRDFAGDTGAMRHLISVSNSYSSTCSSAEEDQDQAEEEDGSAFSSSGTLFLEDLISYSFQVARGMEFLASRKCIHRDLAARNILLSDNNVVKICDFGLARDIYRDPNYVRQGDARLPLKWMSPESIFDKVFTTQSDVWSFGVLLWEIFSLGASPYPGLPIDEDFCQRLKEGTRMRAPEYSTPAIYGTMLACWDSNPAARPTFTALVGTLGEQLQQRVQQDGKDYVPLDTVLPSGADVHLNTHSPGSLGYINTRTVSGLSTFEELPSLDPPGSEDYQTDSGMVLPSEELQTVKWSTNRNPLMSRFFSRCKNQGILPSAALHPRLHSETVGKMTVPGDLPPPDYSGALLQPCL
ncbi:vascular endothelial growth factor receptor 1 isoform X2 [Paramormyrops kingsleyae]|uniref:receptor protein-tyrosine kinase n=1 Tax=Paramormyrops kingsleyae TaxID=1676925 RepID=A0A3B3S306_9TELE|nr:vascular endothelial growth factor receptor 1-like isoform X2 [Paramormyrops kingsleyae]